jgi:hypothetical protein
MSYNTNLIYNLASPVAGSYQLVAGLLEPAGGTNLAGTFSLTFEVTDSSGILVPTQTFTSLAAFDNYFSDKLLSLGTFTGAISGLDFDFGMSTASLEAAGFDFVFGDVPVSSPPSIPEPPAWLLFGSALLGMAFFQRRRREDLLALLQRGFKGEYRDVA